MKKASLIYFAYGSNMLSKRLQDPKRCPSATSIGVAVLPGYELRWHKRSRKDGSAKCDIVECRLPEDSVHGVLYAISEAEKPRLDREEGLYHGYEQIEVEVLRAGEPIRALTYKATDINSALKPYSWYRALVVTGAREHRLPAAYVAQLEVIPADEDPDRKRHDENMRPCGEALA